VEVARALIDTGADIEAGRVDRGWRTAGRRGRVRVLAGRSGEAALVC
jgi:hypothetical protein